MVRIKNELLLQQYWPIAKGVKMLDFCISDLVCLTHLLDQ